MVDEESFGEETYTTVHFQKYNGSSWESEYIGPAYITDIGGSYLNCRGGS